MCILRAGMKRAHEMAGSTHAVVRCTSNQITHELQRAGARLGHTSGSVRGSKCLRSLGQIPFPAAALLLVLLGCGGLGRPAWARMEVNTTDLAMVGRRKRVCAWVSQQLWGFFL